MKRFELLEPRSVQEACRMLFQYGEQAKILSGGTALVKLMKKRLIHPSHLVNMKGIEELHFIREDEEGLKIGALMTMSEVETTPFVRERFGAMAEMIHTIGSLQIRNVGTLVGNLCFADPASDPAPLLISLGASVKVVSSEGERVVPVEGFFKDFYETALGLDEIVEEIRVPFLPKGSGAIYLKHSLRAAFDLGVVGVAVRLGLNSKDGACQDSRVVLGGVASTPIRLKKVEDLLAGKVIDCRLIKKAARAASEGVDPIHDVRASADYRREMVEIFVARGIQKAWERAKGGQLS